MVVSEISNEYECHPVIPEGVEPKNNLYRVWHISIKNKILILKRYGSFCHWSRIILEEGPKEVYRIEVDENKRTEFFNGTPFRDYQDNQFSFVEYLGLMAIIEKFPNQTGLIRYLRIIENKGLIPSQNRISLKPLEQSLIDQYQEQMERILSN